MGSLRGNDLRILPLAKSFFSVINLVCGYETTASQLRQVPHRGAQDDSEHPKVEHHTDPFHPSGRILSGISKFSLRVDP